MNKFIKFIFLLTILLSFNKGFCQKKELAFSDSSFFQRLFITFEGGISINTSNSDKNFYRLESLKAIFENDNLAPTGSFLIQYSLAPRHTIGVGGSINLFQKEFRAFIPVYINYTFYINRKKISPFLYARGGQSIFIDEGPYWGAGIGLKYHSISLLFGYDSYTANNAVLQGDRFVSSELNTWSLRLTLNLFKKSYTN